MSKTRTLLIDVARRLFAEKGYANTTMNDIAETSGKGRRTVYTYFKSKNEIYLAVIKSESDALYARYKEIVQKDLPPEEKLVNYVFVRLEAVKELVERNGSLRAEFFQNIRNVEQARRDIDNKEICLLYAILEEGVEKGAFRIPSIRATAAIMHYAIKGMEVPYIRGNFSELGVDTSRLKEYILDFVLYGIKK